MRCNKTPETGMSIYLNGCSCQNLWEEIQHESQDEDVCQPAPADEDHDCKPPCDFERWPLAMAYVPMQPWEEPFDFDRGLRAGTIFPGLKLPFKGGGC